MRAAMPLSDSAPTEGVDGYGAGSSRRRLGNVEGHRVDERTHGGAMLPLSDAALACLTLFRGAGLDRVPCRQTGSPTPVHSTLGALIKAWGTMPCKVQKGKRWHRPPNLSDVDTPPSGLSACHLPLQGRNRTRPDLPVISRCTRGSVPPQTQKGRPLGAALFHQRSDRVDQKSLRYCSLPMKPSLLTAERLITARVSSTLAYLASGAGWKCSSGSGFMAAV